MPPDPIAEQVLAVVATYTEVPRDQITLETSFESLAIDSLDALSLIAELEDAFAVEIPNEEALRITSVGQAAESLRGRVSEGGERGAEGDAGTP